MSTPFEIRTYILIIHPSPSIEKKKYLFVFSFCFVINVADSQAIQIVVYVRAYILSVYFE